MTLLGRLARHRPALAAVIVGTLAIGIGSATVALLCLVAALACFIPARRAAGIDPMVAMRTE